MSLADLLFGKPLPSSAERAERAGPGAGIAIFGLDALSSAAYGPEAALTLLIPLGAAGIAYILPISGSIVVLLAILYFSYRQTIAAYPTGGGSYTVARENLGEMPGLLAAAALMIDYILTAAVGISAGVGALVSVVPQWQPHTLALCLATLVVLTIANLRGVRQVGAIFMWPTYLFIGSLLSALALGLFKTLAAGGHPVPVAAPPPLHPQAAGLTMWLLLQSFSNGCTAMTGVEAVSNGVRAFREPVVKTAQQTLTVIIAILALMLVGIAYLVRVYHIGATDPGQIGYASVLSQLVAAVAGRNVFYFITMTSVLLVLALSANTAFADFPRLGRAVAHDSYLPHSFASPGRRLVYSQGVVFLAAVCAGLLILFDGVTDKLIPLYAVGAFLAFTLSQAGMVMHWKRVRGPKFRLSMMINGIGAVATAMTVVVVVVAKFAAGAWVTVLLIAAIILVMLAIRHHYDRVEAETASGAPLDVKDLRPPLVVMPMRDWDKVAQKGLRFALKISPDVRVVHVDCGEETEDLRRAWPTLAVAPARQAGLGEPELVILQSPYRYVITPIRDYILDLERRHPNRQLAIIIPEMVEHHWYHYPLHNQRGQWLKALLFLQGERRISVVSVPWYLKD